MIFSLQKNAYFKKNWECYMRQLSHTRPASLNYNTTTGYTLGCIDVQIVTGIFLVMFYCSNAY